MAPPSTVKTEIIGQLAVGDYVLQVGGIHGARVTRAPSGALPVTRPRSVPVFLRPRPFPGLLDRATEIASAVSALQSGLPVEFYGEKGVGKATILRHLAHHPVIGGFPDGVVYLIAGDRPASDLLYSLFDIFYETDVPFKPTEAQVSHGLREKQALVLLDNVRLERDEIEEVMHAAPGCNFILASRDRHLWGEVRAIAIGGLSLDGAMTLVERELERPLTLGERRVAQTLDTALDGHPMRLLQAAAMVREKGLTLLDIVPPVETTSPSDVIAAHVSSLPEAEKQILKVLAVWDGSLLEAQTLAELTRVASIEPLLESLVRQKLVQASGSRYSLSATLKQDSNEAWDLNPWRDRTLNYFTTWAEQNQRQPQRVWEEADSIEQILKLAAGQRRWPEVLRLGKAVEGALALSGRWGVWALMLQQSLQAATEIRDRAAEAWVRHQWGSRALCLGQNSNARESLGQALQIRESIGDRLGAGETRHNLGFLVPQPAIDTAPAVQEPPSMAALPTMAALPSRAGLRFPKLAAALLVLALVGLGVWYANRGSQSMLGAPIELSLSVPSPTEINLQWKNNSSNLTGFRIERKTIADIFTEVGNVGADARQFKVSGLDPNTTHSFRVVALSSNDDVAHSQEATGLTLPAVPSGLFVHALSQSRLELSWADKSPNPSGFKIDRSTDGGSTFTEIARVPPGAMAYSDTDVAGSSKYQYRVRATNSTGDSGYSNTVTFVMPSALTSGPEPSSSEFSRTVETPRSDADLDSITLTQSSVRGGSRVQGMVQLTGPETARSVRISLSSTHPKLITLPQRIRVQGGQNRATFDIRTRPVLGRKAERVVITASMAGTNRKAILTVEPEEEAVRLISVRLTERSVLGGNSTIGEIQLSGPAPAGSRVVALTSSSPSVAIVPAYVTIPAGEKTAIFDVRTTPLSGRGPEQVTIRAYLGGVSREVSLTVEPQKKLSALSR